MENGIPLVHVLGIGHLAAAIRARLHHLRRHASDVDCWINSDSAALFLACSDFENASLRRSLAARARDDRSTLLFACLHGHTTRLGPLITPLSRETLSSHYLTRSWDFSRSGSDTATLLAHANDLPTHSTDTAQITLAQIGATFVIGELAKLLFGAHDLSYERVTKIDAPTNFSECSPQAFPDLHPGTLLATATWPDLCHLPTHTWHPAQL